MKKTSLLWKCIALAMALVFVLSFAACGDDSDSSSDAADVSAKANTADATVTAFFDAVKAGNFDGAQKLLKTPMDDLKADGASADEVKMAKAIFSGIKYKVASSKEEGNSATVTMNVSIPDMTKVMEVYMQKLTDAMTNGEISADASEEEAAEFGIETMNKVFTDPNLVTVAKDITFKVAKDGDAWIIEDTGDFQKQVFDYIEESFGG